MKYLGLRSLVLLLGLLAILPPAWTGGPLAFGSERAQAATAEPPPLATPAAPSRYLGREIATTMHYTGAPWLVRESRQREEDCESLLRALAVKPGETVCDLGCGNGFYTLKLARLVGPKGRVYAVDIQPEMLRMLKESARRQRLPNVVPVLGRLTDPRLPEREIDLVLMVDVYHEFSHPQAMLAAIGRSLKPGGRVAVAEFRAEDPQVPIQPLHKMSKSQVLREFAANRFLPAGQFDRLPWQHLLFFRPIGAE